MAERIGERRRRKKEEKGEKSRLKKGGKKERKEGEKEKRLKPGFFCALAAAGVSDQPTSLGTGFNNNLT